MEATTSSNDPVTSDETPEVVADETSELRDGTDQNPDDDKVVEEALLAWALLVVKEADNWKIKSVNKTQNHIQASYWATLLVEKLPNLKASHCAMSKLKSTPTYTSHSNIFDEVIKIYMNLQAPSDSSYSNVSVTGTITQRTKFYAGSYCHTGADTDKNSPQLGARLVSNVTANLAKCMNVIKLYGYNKAQQTIAEKSLKTRLEDLKTHARGVTSGKDKKFVDLTILLRTVMGNEIGPAQPAIPPTPNPKKNPTDVETTNMTVSDHMRVMMVLVDPRVRPDVISMQQRKNKQDLDSSGFNGPMERGLKAIVVLFNDRNANFYLPQSKLFTGVVVEAQTTPLLRPGEENLNQKRRNDITTAQVYHSITNVTKIYRRTIDKFKNLTGANGQGDCVSFLRDFIFHQSEADLTNTNRAIGLLAFYLFHDQAELNGAISFIVYASLPEFACRGGSATGGPPQKRHRHSGPISIEIGEAADRKAQRDLDVGMAAYYAAKISQAKSGYRIMALNDRIAILEAEKLKAENFVTSWAEKGFQYPAGTAGGYIQKLVEQKSERLDAIDNELAELHTQVKAAIPKDD